MRIIAISDTHSKHHEVQLPPYQPGDILVHAGDMTHKGELATIQNFAQWCKTLPYDHTIVIAGNHDFCFQDERHYLAESILFQAGITYLYDKEITINGIKFYGSPWQPWFFDWAFNVKRGELYKKWQNIPADTDVLITHGPAAPNLGGAIPEVRAGDAKINEVGDHELFEQMKYLTNLKYHICGHIHECYGIYDNSEISCKAVNASVLNLAYDCVNKPWILPIEEKRND